MAIEMKKICTVSAICPQCKKQEFVWVIDPRGAAVTCMHCSFKYTVKIVEEAP